MYDKNHYNIVISLQLIKINGKKKLKSSIILFKNINEMYMFFLMKSVSRITLWERDNGFAFISIETKIKVVL